MITINTKIHKEVLIIGIHLENNEDEDENVLEDVYNLGIKSKLNELENVSKIKEIHVSIFNNLDRICINSDNLFNKESLELLNKISDNITYNLMQDNKTSSLNVYNFDNIYIENAEYIDVDTRTKNLFIDNTIKVNILSSYINTLRVSGNSKYNVHKSYIKEIMHLNDNIELPNDMELYSYIGNINYSLMLNKITYTLKQSQGDKIFNINKNYNLNYKANKIDYLKRYLDENITY